MRDGVAPRGNLYPVMPYTSYRLIDNSDMHDLYLYFMHTKPVAEPNKKNDIDFPFDIRWGISVWNWLELDEGTFHPVSGKTALWNRGNYLISGLGHCSECHTPRNLLMSPEFSKQFQGSIIDGIMAPNITPQELKRQGWTMESLTHLQQSGTSVKGSAFADMYIVEHDSLSSLNRYDRQAIAAYLLNENVNYNPSAIKYEKIPLIFKENNADGNQEGFSLYNNDCAGCHGSDGQGKPNVVPTLQGNATLNHTSSYNTIAVIINGIPKEYYNSTDSFYPMPSFGQSLTNKQIAQLTNYLRHRWTTQTNTVTEKTVEKVRKNLTPTSSSI
jgi:mono/diheme cytochrome c family protein